MFCKNIEMVEYNKVIAKLSDLQLNKLKSAAQNQTGVTLRMSMKMFNENNLPYELFLKTKLRNAFENNMSTDIKLPEIQASKIIQSGGFLGLLLIKIAGPLMKVAVPLAKNILAPLVIKLLLLQQLIQESKRKHMVLEQQL